MPATLYCVTWGGGANPLWTYPQTPLGANRFVVTFTNPNTVDVDLQLTKFSSALIYGPSTAVHIPASNSVVVPCTFHASVLPPASAGIAQVITNGGSAWYGLTKICDFDIEFDST